MSAGAGPFAGVVMPRPARAVVRTGNRVIDGFADLGLQLRFYARALTWLPRAMVRYWREVLRLVSDISFGSGALLVGGGTVSVIFALSFFSGSELGLQGFKGLQIIGLGRGEATVLEVCRLLEQVQPWIARPALTGA